MKHIATASAVFVMSVIAASAQLMPQDNWRVSGVTFGSPTDNNLRSIAAGSGGVYVGEVNASNPTQVLQFTEAGTFVQRFSQDFGSIHGIACDATGNVYVLSRGNTRVRVFDANGAFIREWGSYGTGDGQFNLEGTNGNTMIAVNHKTNEVFVCDPGNSRVQVFSLTGTFLRKWGQAGSLPGQFQAGGPSAIVAADNGHVVVANSNGAFDPSIKVFDVNGNYLKGANLEWAGFNTWAIAASHDGLVAVDYDYANNIDYDPHQRIYVLDPGENYVNIGGLPHVKTSAGCAFSRRGDFYTMYGNRVTQYVREYSNAANFPAAPAIPHGMILSAGQRAGTNLVDIAYQVKDPDSATAHTAMLAVRDGSTINRTGYSVPMRTFVENTATNIGTGQPTGVTRNLVWNMPADWGVDYANFEIEVLSKDSRNPLGIHWITVPASGGQPAIQVSSAPITNPQLRDLWLWYLGNGLVNQTYYNAGGNGWLGTVWGKSGVYTGIKLAEDYNHPYQFNTYPTTAGLTYAYEQIGGHPITPAELIRAQAGKYGFASVDGNSIVKNLGPTTSYLKGWGRNDYGQSSWQSFAAPNISKVAAGHLNTFFIRADGTLWAVGYNNYGQLGDGTTTNRTGPIQIATGVTEVSTGGSHTMFVKTDGTLWAMGLNDYGQLGNSGSTNLSTPVQVATNISKVACGWRHSMWITTTNQLYGVGLNTEGELGNGTFVNQPVPVLVTTGVAQVAAGMHHTLFIKTVGNTLMATGYNNYGQLGNGNTANQHTPYEVDTDVAQASASCGDDQGHSVFVKNNGSLWVMGRNTHGQLGDGLNGNRSTKFQIVASGVSRAMAGSLHTVFMKTDKTVWSTGNNNYGQLGDNTTTNRNTPAQFDVNASAIAVGSSHTLAVSVP